MTTSFRTVYAAVFGLLVLVALAVVPLEAASPESFRFSGDRTSVTLAEGRERTVLSGNAEIVSDDTQIRADRIEIYGRNFRYAVAEGNVRVVDSKRDIHLSAARLFFDREADQLRAEGNVIMEDRANELLVRGRFLENRNEEELTIVQAGVRILGEDLTARGEYARYRRDIDTLEISGMPVVFRKGDEYRATRITIDLDRDEIVLQGEVRGRITTNDDDPEDGE
ncbi:MAG: hypothetical protein EA428_12035 [Spirochaetaceae bacterium]|nr:MAG: hypothetical protein EA428_12035 [Spirochaetaceae bacterium]